MSGKNLTACDRTSGRGEFNFKSDNESRMQCSINNDGYETTRLSKKSPSDPFMSFREGSLTILIQSGLYVS